MPSNLFEESDELCRMKCFAVFVYYINMLGYSRRWKCLKTVVNSCRATMCVTKRNRLKTRGYTTVRTRNEFSIDVTTHAMNGKFVHCSEFELNLNLLTNSQWRQAKAWRAHWQRKNTEKKKYIVLLIHDLQFSQFDCSNWEEKCAAATIKVWTANIEKFIKNIMNMKSQLVFYQLV